MRVWVDVPCPARALASYLDFLEPIVPARTLRRAAARRAARVSVDPMRWEWGRDSNGRPAIVPLELGRLRPPLASSAPVTARGGIDLAVLRALVALRGGGKSGTAALLAPWLARGPERGFLVWSLRLSRAGAAFAAVLVARGDSGLLPLAPEPPSEPMEPPFVLEPGTVVAAHIAPSGTPSARAEASATERVVWTWIALAEGRRPERAVPGAWLEEGGILLAARPPRGRDSAVVRVAAKSGNVTARGFVPSSVVEALWDRSDD